jgi:translocation and assembly module TamA
MEVGVLLNDDFDNVPLSKRFFTGGDQTVRGYNFESLSPRDSAGDLIGGDRLNVASVEYRWRFKPQWALALFVDSGRAYFDSSAPFRTGAGFGGRWFSPIGQVSVDLAFPISDAEYDGFQIHISMGPSI